MGDKEADCQGRRVPQNRKSRNDLHADGNGAERLGPLPGEGWVWVTKRRTVRDAGYLRTEKAAMTCMRTVTERSDLALSRERVGCG